ncbi:MAG: zinc-ribbon domain-containing protein [Candidatus Fimivivens sp.]
MFFIGLFGTNFKVNSVGYIQAGHCPCCGSGKSFHLAKKHHYFHAFLLPLYKFQSSYFATCPKCASIFEVSDILGKEVEQNGTAHTAQGALRLLQNNYRPACPHCAALLRSSDHFCPNCGKAVDK